MSIFLIGDVHGQFERLTTLLRGVGLIDTQTAWVGGTHTLVLLGDLTDRGPDGLGVINLLMRLEREAKTAGGEVDVLLGNHEVLLLAAHHFGRPFLDDWLANGGVQSDMDGLQVHHLAWLEVRPAMRLLQGHLLLHSDSVFYGRYGGTVEEVNSAIRYILEGDDIVEWSRLLQDIFERRVFGDARRGAARARGMLDLFGGGRIVHGHTPIPIMTGLPVQSVTEALVYANGLCLNLDGGMAQGGTGFVYKFEPRVDLSQM